MSFGQWFGGGGLPNFKLMVGYFKQLTVHIIWRTLVINSIMPKVTFQCVIYFHSFTYAPLCFRIYLNVTAFQHVSNLP